MNRGRLRIYLGAAPGVGKTFAMLDEGYRRRERGTDVVVGYVETHGRVRTAEQVRDLEVVPRRGVAHRGSTFEEMDVDAVLARGPEVALVDELAHTNVPGSRNEKRWQDVEELLAAGIDVVTTLNVQHLESMNDVVEAITGVRQQETVPDEVARAADQVELVDMTAEALRRRMAHGNVYGPDRIQAALTNYFRAGNLEALRELALLWVADQVDEGLLAYREDHGIAGTWETRERVVVALTGAPSGDQLIRRAARMARRGRGDLVGVHVRSTDGRRDAPAELLEAHRQLLEDLGGTYHELVGDDVVDVLMAFAVGENATQLVLGSTRRSRATELLRGSVINDVIRDSGDIDVHVISTAPPADEARLAGGRRRFGRPSGFVARRLAAAWVVATVGTALLTVLLANTRDTFGQGTQFLLYLLVVLGAAAIGGAAPAVAAAVLGFLALNWFFTPPFHTLTIADPENVLALVVFLVVAFGVGLLVTAYSRRAADARRGHAEAEALARIAAGLVGADDPLPSMLDRVRTTLGLDGVALLAADAGEVLVTVGVEPDPYLDRVLELPDGLLVLKGRLGDEDRRVLEAFAAQLASALERRRLRDEAADAERLAQADAFRTALLRAVSHDLRTPLASIKASVTSLLQADVDWSDDERHEFLATVDEESDKLDRLVGNLLDAGRLESGAMRPDVRTVAPEEVVVAALRSLSRDDVPVTVDVAPDLPLVLADPGLLERALANLLENAVGVTPAGGAVAVQGRADRDEVVLEVVDHGPGVPAAERERMFEPFQRLGDSPGGTGVGLGLAVARGVVEAMDGTLRAGDTVGGGLTMAVALPRADVVPGEPGRRSVADA